MVVRRSCSLGLALKRPVRTAEVRWPPSRRTSRPWRLASVSARRRRSWKWALVTAAASQARCHAGKDFLLAADGRISRADGQTATAYLGAQLIRTEALSQVPEPVFSLNRLWDMAIAKGRAYGVIHRGGWCDVGTPQGLAEAERMLPRVDAGRAALARARMALREHKARTGEALWHSSHARRENKNLR